MGKGKQREPARSAWLSNHSCITCLKLARDDCPEMTRTIIMCKWDASDDGSNVAFKSISRVLRICKQGLPVVPQNRLLSDKNVQNRENLIKIANLKFTSGSTIAVLKREACK